MGTITNISWTDTTWNPVIGCSKVSPGCAHCYAEELSKSSKMRPFGYTGLPWTPENAHLNVQLKPERLDQPLHWYKPRRVFVNSMSDLFHELVPFEFIDKVFAVMALAPQHIFQILTKRPERMLEYMASPGRRVAVWVEAREIIEQRRGRDYFVSGREVSSYTFPGGPMDDMVWPLPNVWLGTSVENQHWADVRIPLLLKVPAAVRFLSCEPLLAQVSLLKAMPLDDQSDVWDEVNADDWETYEPEMEIEEAELEGDWINYGLNMAPNPAFKAYHRERERRARTYMLRDGIQWVIVGGESGPKHRAMDLDWARHIRDQCQEAGVAFFFKQSGGARSETGKLLDGVAWNEVPTQPWTRV